jgi:uroporphyrinogen III methyltransferase/synthase
VLLTRPAGRSAALARRLRALGARVAERPTIAFEGPLDPGPPRRAIAGLEQYDWLVFSSATGVEFFLRRLWEAGRGAPPAQLRAAAVGSGTARRLEAAGIPVQVVGIPNTAEGLAGSLRRELQAGDRVLWIRPEAARPVLQERLTALGARVDAVPFYRTVAAKEVSDVARALHEESFDVVVFTSPSTFHRLVEADARGGAACVERLRQRSIVAIGPVTAAALQRQGLPPQAVAETAGEEAVVEAVRLAVDARREQSNAE